MENDINNSETCETIYHDELKYFVEEHCPAYSDDISLWIEEIKMTEIKNSKTKIPIFTLQIYAFVYDILMDFSAFTFIVVTIATQDFFENVYKLINFKVHIHDSHVTGKITGYAHNFCYWKVRQNQTWFSCIAHNYLNFDFYFMFKGYRVLCWVEDKNTGGSNLSNVSFLNIGEQMKIIDTMKYCQTSLVQVGFTVTSEEKQRIKKLMLQFW